MFLRVVGNFIEICDRKLIVVETLVELPVSTYNGLIKVRASSKEQ